MTLLRTQFKLELPKALRDHMDKVAEDYGKTLLVAPVTTRGKVVVEVSDDPVGGVTHVVRSLLTADFEPDKGVPGSSEPKYWESWMVLLGMGEVKDGLKVVTEEIYVHREGGWEQVRSLSDGKPRAPQHEDGDPWPEPAGEPPANKGVVSVASMDALDKTDPLWRHYSDMLKAGGHVVDNEMIVDFRNEDGRRAFWRFTAEVKKRWPR